MSDELNRKPQLEHALGLYQATALVVGNVIGSGIFVATAAMAKQLPNGWHLMAIWVFTGLMTALGALTQSELSSRMPVTGGLYAYFREVFGDSLAFFYGWANFMIAGSGAIAGIAFIFASYLSEFVPLWHASKEWQEWALYIPYVGRLYPAADLGQKIVGTILILGLTAINVRGVRLGALVQSISVTTKTIAILLIIIAALFFHGGSWAHLNTGSISATSTWGLIAIWFTAMGGAFWSYDGWGGIAYIGGEIRNPQKNLPRAILLGVGIIVGIYLLINFAYLHVLNMQAIASAPGERVASAVMSAVLGRPGVVVVALLILLSTFDAVNSTILTNGRVYFAMAKEKLFWKPAGKISEQHHTPAVSLWLQGLWSVVLLVSGSFDLIFSMYVFINWLFYFLIPVALFILRRRAKNQPSPTNGIFRVPLYPYLPISFAIFTFAYVMQTLISDIQSYQAGTEPCIKSLMGLLLVLSGTPFLIILKRKKFKRIGI